MVDDDQDGPDLETLQAQIDQSMAFTQNIVSGWMKSSKAKLPSSSSRNDDKELEEYMRRPARLGVGASAPEASGVLSRETAKLRNKLTGNGKKRERDGDDEPAHAGAKPGGGPTAASDDDEDSRARVITKKARVDPFAAKDEGKKKKKKKDPMDVAAPAGKHKHQPAPSSAPPAAGEEDVEMGEVDRAVGAADAKSPEDGAAPPAPSKKKKKKKHKASVAQDDTQPEDPEQRHDAVASPVPEKKDVASKQRPTEPSPSSKSRTASAGGSLRESGVEVPPSSAHSAAPADAAAAAKKTSAVRQDPLGVPLLNLSGPPPTNDEHTPESPKKKRKRKKKKKKAVAQSADEPNPREDGESDDE